MLYTLPSCILFHIARNGSGIKSSFISTQDCWRFDSTLSDGDWFASKNHTSLFWSTKLKTDDNNNTITPQCAPTEVAKAGPQPKYAIRLYSDYYQSLFLFSSPGCHSICWHKQRQVRVVGERIISWLVTNMCPNILSYQWRATNADWYVKITTFRLTIMNCMQYEWSRIVRAKGFDQIMTYQINAWQG